MPEFQTRVSGEDGSYGAYVARPAHEPKAAIVVIQEIFGVNRVMRGVCDDFAAAGFLAVCPDLFWRHEPGIELDDNRPAELQRAFELYGVFDVDSGIKDIDATIQHVRGEMGQAKVGAVGYCLGGLLAYLTACRTDVDASVSYYGVGIDQRLEEAEKLAQPLLMHIAEADEFVPPAAQAAIRAGLKNHPMVTIHTYAGQKHAFARKGGAHHNEEAARLADGRSLQFFLDRL